MTFSASRFSTSRLISSAYHSPDLVSPNASFTLVTVNPVPDGVKGEPVDECDVQLESFQTVIGSVFGEPAAELADPATELDVQLESGQPVIDAEFDENAAEFDENAAELDENAAELDEPAAARCPVGADCASLTHALFDSCALQACLMLSCDAVS